MIERWCDNMKLFKRKLTFIYEDAPNGILVTTRVKGNLTLNDILCAKKIIDNKIKDNGKNERK